MYSNDCMSEAESEIPDHCHIPTPKFGESYSQSGYTVVVPKKAGSLTNGGSQCTGMLQSGSAPSQSEEEGDYQNVSIQRGCPQTENQLGSNHPAEEEDDTQFIDNDAYDTVTFQEPKFEIVSSERGRVFETVKVK